MQPQSGGKFRPRLNTGERPIANKYCEVKMKSVINHILDGLHNRGPNPYSRRPMSMSLKAQAHVLEDSPYDARLALNENPKNPNPKNRGYYSSATLFIGDTVHRRHCSSAILFIAVTIHRRYCSSRLLFIAVTIHRRYCSSRLLFIAATVHRDYCSSPLLFIAATIHRRYCSSPLLFIAATVHRGYYSSPLLFIAATVHRRYCSSRLLFIAATVHRRYCSSPLLFVAATVHRGYYSSPLLFITILFIVGTVHRSYCSSRYCSSSTLFIAVLFAVRCSSAHPLSSPMVVRSLGLDSDSFGPKKDEEEVLGPEVPYLSAIGALMNYVWLDPFQGYVGSLLQDAATTTSKTIIFGDNTACIAQLKDGYIKGDRTKHILPKFFFTHDLQRDGEVRVVQVRSSDNSADLFTKALPTSTLRKLTHQIGMRRLKDLQG
ncbi:hypothetical protein ISN44_Un262g000030 [Arabidopsis suecica]|uniref:Uncharacterized protein n=1 Tax=Arabidopsis suecica TaxID=45249 RepID=A0A8T1X9M3_ARASU|nr:hypothetical protein ISN44_Un262g000030 [Arabidopsis suecica]